MARSKKSKTTSKSTTGKTLSEDIESKAKDTVEAAEDSIESAVEAVTDAVETAEETVTDAVEEVTGGSADDTLDAAKDAEPEHDSSDTAIEDTSETDAAPDDQTEDLAADSEPEAEVGADSAQVQDAAEVTAAPIVQEKIIERKGGFVPMVLGGVIAAALGYGASAYTAGTFPFGSGAEEDPFRDEVQQTLDAQSDQLAALDGGLQDAQKAIEVIDLNPMMSALAGVEDQLAQTNGTIAGLDEQIAGFDSRLTALEKQPVAAAVGPEAIAAYERELDELRRAIQAQQDAVAAQTAEIEAMAKEALAAEAGAEEQATLAASRAALAELTNAAQAGQPFAEPLAVLTGNGVAVPDALASAAADGVPTLTALAADFPGLARDALRVARTTETEGEESGGGFASFLQSQLGARSVTPREGNDPDAVLSRAEAAVQSGDLDAALTEINALPEGAQSVLADWTATAGARRDALAAASELAQQLNQ